MGAILLGSANGTPPEQGTSGSIAIPNELPVDPTVLVDVQGPAPPCTIEEGTTENGIPVGGAPDQVLTKLSSADYDAGWENPPAADIPEDTTINRTDGLISSIVKASKTVNITRDGDGLITNVNDGTYSKDIIRTDGVITFIDVTVL